MLEVFTSKVATGGRAFKFLTLKMPSHGLFLVFSFLNLVALSNLTYGPCYNVTKKPMRSNQNKPIMNTVLKTKST